METHYLIDYENDGKNGLKGCENLSNTDYIHLFYTDNLLSSTLGAPNHSYISQIK